MDTLSREATLLKCFLPTAKGVYSKRKAFAPIGSKCFLFRIDTFLEKVWCVGEPSGSQNSCLLCQNGRKSRSVSSFLNLKCARLG